jgi:hypothetical protein
VPGIDRPRHPHLHGRKIWNVTDGGASLCERYTGNDTGAEPVKTGSGIDGQYCISLNSAP